MRWPRIRQLTLISLMIALSLAGLLFLIERAPIFWQAEIAPAYLPYWALRNGIYRVEEGLTESLRTTIGEYEAILARPPLDDPWVYSEVQERVIHIDFVRSDLMHHQRELEEHQRERKCPSRPSFLRYLWENSAFSRKSRGPDP